MRNYFMFNLGYTHPEAKTFLPLKVWRLCAVWTHQSRETLWTLWRILLFVLALVITYETCRLTSQCNAMFYWQLGTNNHILCMGCRGHYCTLCRKRVLKSPGHYGPRGCQQHTDPWDSKSCCIQYITPLYRTSSPLPVFASTCCPRREDSCWQGQCKFAIGRFHGSILARTFDIKNKWFAM